MYLTAERGTSALLILRVCATMNRPSRFRPGFPRLKGQGGFMVAQSFKISKPEVLVAAVINMRDIDRTACRAAEFVADELGRISRLLTAARAQTGRVVSVKVVHGPVKAVGPAPRREGDGGRTRGTRV